MEILIVALALTVFSPPPVPTLTTPPVTAPPTQVIEWQFPSSEEIGIPPPDVIVRNMLDHSRRQVLGAGAAEDA